MNAIIVDDEKRGREILEKLLDNYCPEVRIKAAAASADEAYTYIRKYRPDIVFLDIEMPNGNGFYLLEKFDTLPFRVIFTTAYDNYAIQAIKHNAFDYLLKPIDIDELRIAVSKVKKVTAATPVTPADIASGFGFKPGSRIALPVKEGNIYLMLNNIVRVASDGSYSVFYTDDGKKYMVSKNLKVYEDLLPKPAFFRVHKSHLINIKKVTKYLSTDGYFAELEDGSVVEISRRKKDEFLQLMNTMY